MAQIHKSILTLRCAFVATVIFQLFAIITISYWNNVNVNINVHTAVPTPQNVSFSSSSHQHYYRYRYHSDPTDDEDSAAVTFVSSSTVATTETEDDPTVIVVTKRGQGENICAHVDRIIQGGATGYNSNSSNNNNNDHPTTTNNSNTTAVPRGHVVFRFGCDVGSTGNWLSYIFTAALYASQHNYSFQLDCPPIMNTNTSAVSSTTTVQSLLSQPPHNIWMYRPPFHNTTQSMDFCKSIPYFHTHQHRYGLQLAVPLIRTVLRLALPRSLILPPSSTSISTTNESPNSTIDDVAIHFRCGDILASKSHTEYGYPRYEFYRSIIHDHFFATTATTTATSEPPLSIAIVTASWDSSLCRPNLDCEYISICQGLVHDLVDYLKTAISHPTVVRIRHDQAATPISFARLMHAKLTICNPSTFCVYPTIAAYGEAYIVQSERLYPFITDLPDRYQNIHVANVEFLNMGHIQQFREAGHNLVTAITQWARNSTTTPTAT